MEAIINFFTGTLNTVAWLYIFLPCTIVGGLYLTIRNRGIQFTRFGYAMKNTVGKMFQKQEAGAGAVTPLQAVTTALAATVGTGNIVGTSQAIALGGYGAVFWLWLAALLGMIIKYSEVTLSIKYRERDAKGDWVGGPMYYVKNGLGKHWQWVGVLFCVFAAIASFGIGNMSQVNSIVGSLNDAIDAFIPAAEGERKLLNFVFGVVIAAPEGVPSEELLQQVQDDLDAVREIAVDVTVLAPEVQAVGVTAQLLPKTGVSFETAKAAAEKADNLKEVKFGKKKAAIEELQATVRDMSNAQSEAVDAQFALAKAEKQASEALRISFECQSKLGEMAKAMVQYSVSNVAHSRIVVRELEARLNGANREELSDLARQELESVCAEIQRQQDIMAKQEQLFHEVHEHDKQLVRVREENEGRDQAIAAQVQKSVDIVQRLAAQAVRVNEQQKILYTHQEKNAEHDRRLDEGEQRDARQDELLKQHSQTD